MEIPRHIAGHHRFLCRLVRAMQNGRPYPGEGLQPNTKGKLNIYKVDTDKEQELAGAFGIQSIPSLLFIPMAGQPQMTARRPGPPGF